MINVYHVLTPFSRFENLRSLIDMLAAQRSPKFEVQWHPIFDENLPFGIHFPQRWITPGFCPPSKPFWSCWADALNRFISAGPLEPESRYCILNDDDAYEPGFFEKVDAVEGEVIAVSMHRGKQIPPGVAAERAHGTNDLIACPDNMIPGRIGAEQIITTGRIFAKHGFENRIDADGWRIMAIAKEDPSRIVYLPDAWVLFNRYEPGRW